MLQCFRALSDKLRFFGVAKASSLARGSQGDVRRGCLLSRPVCFRTSYGFRTSSGSSGKLGRAGGCMERGCML